MKLINKKWFVDLFGFINQKNIILFFLSYVITLFINYPIHYQFNHLEIFVDAFLLYIWGWIGYMIITAGISVEEESRKKK